MPCCARTSARAPRARDTAFYLLRGHVTNGKLHRATLATYFLIAAVTAGIPASADEASVGPAQPASGAPEISGDVASSLEATSVATGSVSAHWSVTPQGAFAYSLPIEVPAGRGGLAPKIG